MAEQARVQSIEALTRFRSALVEFADGAKHALGGIDIELRRVREWLEHDQPRYWKSQVRLWDQRMNEARSALHRKNLQRTEGYVPDVTQEKEALRLCKHRIEEAERKLASIRRWVPRFQHALSEYQGRTRSLSDAASIDVERMIAMLDRMITALESYVSTAPPRESSGMPPPGPSGGLPEPLPESN
ncbi:hypothetical protein [Tautonia plasticadhaerens]|uniref:Chromosome partition protein Smc n=1 Tax=Tautonia plasticadhaerens TaxID=2527974 RepID=A0A518H9G5_9BACT|nr:hypothetical protein [Tautonia plasticadhaerens]QDV37489.1 hypothetical protein ElP_54290 [Tautonia plasticadhaerens]